MNNNKNIYVIGAGLLGCLTAWKVKKKYPKKNVRLIESSDHIMSVFDPISIGGYKVNKGFHGIELPRGEPLYNFIKDELRLELKVVKNIKKMIIDGCVVDYTDGMDEYPNKIKNYYKKVSNPNNYSAIDYFNFTSDEFKCILQKISSRYSDNFEDVLHLLIPWFCPSEFVVNSQDEGDLFRNSVRSNRVKPYYAWPESHLFSDIQPAFESALRELGVEIFLSQKVSFLKDEILIDILGDGSNCLDLGSDIVFLCAPPVEILKVCSDTIFRNLTSRSRDLYNILLCGSASSDCIPFSEILCCDPKFIPLSRISSPPIGESRKTYLQLEMFMSPQEVIDGRAIDELVGYINDIMPSLGYGDFSFVGLKNTRKVYFPDPHVVCDASKCVRTWSDRFSNLKILESFGPINMAKTWLYSDSNENFLNTWSIK